MKTLQVGDKVKFTGKFLRNTGQQLGREGQSVWTIIACDCGLCKGGRFIATDEPSYDEPSQPRHILAANVYKKGTLHSDNA